MEEDGRELTIGIESAIGSGSISVFRGRNEIDSLTGSGGISRAEDLLLSVDGLLRRNSFSRGELARIAVSTGPGSFTGIKIGIATAVGLADALACPCLGISALYSMALAATAVGDVLVAVPVGRDLACVQRYNKTADDAIPISLSETISKKQLEQELRVFPGAAVLEEQLFESLAMNRTNRVYSASANLASLLVRSCLDGHGSTSFVPLYVDRKSPVSIG